MSELAFGLSIPPSVLPGTDPVASARMAEDSFTITGPDIRQQAERLARDVVPAVRLAAAC